MDIGESRKEAQNESIEENLSSDKIIDRVGGGNDNLDSDWGNRFNF